MNRDSRLNPALFTHSLRQLISPKEFPMDEVFDLRLDFPKLQGFRVNAVQRSIKEDLVLVLKNNGFKVYLIDGSQITDEASFYQEIKRAFEFPDYFGMNWHAFTDCLSDIELQPENRVSIIWDSVNCILKSNFQLFIETVGLFDALARDLTYPEQTMDQKEVEIFYLGDGAAFQEWK
jgi:RNAse (barnase) inhibitor barstar